MGQAQDVAQFMDVKLLIDVGADDRRLDVGKAVARRVKPYAAGPGEAARTGIGGGIVTDENGTAVGIGAATIAKHLLKGDIGHLGPALHGSLDSRHLCGGDALKRRNVAEKVAVIGRRGGGAEGIGDGARRFRRNGAVAAQQLGDGFVGRLAGFGGRRGVDMINAIGKYGHFAHVELPGGGRGAKCLRHFANRTKYMALQASRPI